MPTDPTLAALLREAFYSFAGSGDNTFEAIAARLAAANVRVGTPDALRERIVGLREHAQRQGTWGIEYGDDQFYNDVMAALAAPRAEPEAVTRAKLVHDETHDEAEMCGPECSAFIAPRAESCEACARGDRTTHWQHEHPRAEAAPCTHGTLIDGDHNCPDCGAPVIYRAEAAPPPLDVDRLTWTLERMAYGNGEPDYDPTYTLDTGDFGDGDLSPRDFAEAILARLSEAPTPTEDKESK